MILTQITQEIKPLSRMDKWQLIEVILKMLREEESPAKYFKPGANYPVFTPSGSEKAAAQLQQFLDQQTS
ncbi:hypothetical protein JW964_13870 [candidate division KSB1 bacterium]|nr:hypothetical protein [candidate division KSB1 bacterium]